MRTLFAFAAALLAASCGASSRQSVQFATLRFEMPADWEHHDTSFKGVATTMWTPDANEAKESITVLRTEDAPQLEHASEAQLQALVVRAQAFAGAKIASAGPIRTANGFSGVRVELDYVPPGLHDRYHRVHVVLVDGAALVHVIYTARSADPHLAGLSTVLATIRQGEG